MNILVSLFSERLHVVKKFFKMSTKGHKIALSTFKSWGKEEIIGYKSECIDGKTSVNFVYCKVCARNKEAISSHPSCKGEARKSMLNYVNGTTFVTKHTVIRHLSSRAHSIALESERSKPQEECILTHASSSGYSQPIISSIIENSSNELYKKMFNTAYELALQPS